MSIEELIELVQLHGTSIYRFCYKLTDNADRGVYLAVSSGTAFYSDKAFGYDETTGMTYIKDDYEGAAVLYELPLDPNKADHAKARLICKLYYSQINLLKLKIKEIRYQIPLMTK